MSLSDIRSGVPSLPDVALDRLDTRLAELHARREIDALDFMGLGGSR